VIDKNIAFIGAGFMGSALMRGLVKSKAMEPARIMATDPRDEILKPLEDQLGVKTCADNAAAARSADIVVFAVKPQILKRLWPEREEVLMGS